MRDYFLLVIIILLALYALRKPQAGLLGWLWISIMNPHKYSFGFMYSAPLLDGLVAATLIGCLIHWKERARVPFHPMLKVMFAFYIWCTLTTIFAVQFEYARGDWIQFSKTMLLVYLLLQFMNKKHWIIACYSVFVISLSFTGVKGGLFTIMTGGGHRVWGPPTSAWGDNNGVSLAMLMAIPLAVGLAPLFKRRLYLSLIHI